MRTGSVLSTLSILLALALGAGEARGQVVQGRVMDQVAGTPVSLASVELVEVYTGLSTRAITNDAGLFHLDLNSEGPFAVEVLALGYLPYVDTLRVPPGQERVEVEVRLGIDAIPLEALVVTASRAPWWEVTEPRVLWDYFERRDLQEKLGLGTFYGSKDLRERFAAGPLSLLVEMWPPRAEALSTSLRGEPCVYQFYVDGLKWSGGVNDIPFRISDLYSVEIYRGPSEIPAEFLDSSVRCGVMVFWTWRSAQIG